MWHDFKDEQNQPDPNDQPRAADLRPDVAEGGRPEVSALTVRPPRKRRKLKAMLYCAGLLTLVVAGVWTALEIEPRAVRAQRDFVSSARPEEMKHLTQSMEARLYESLGFAKSQGAPAAGPFSARPGSLVLENQQDGGVDAAETAIADLKRPRRFVLTPEEANAWLAVNFKDWMDYRGFELPEQVSDPLIAVDGSQLLMSFEYTGRRVSQTFTADFWIEFQDSGMAKLKVTALSAGSVPIPLERMSEYLAEHSPDSETAERVGEWLSKLEDAEFKPVVKLENRLRALMVGYEVIDGNIEVTLVLEDRSGIYTRKAKPKSKAGVTVHLPKDE